MTGHLLWLDVAFLMLLSWLTLRFALLLLLIVVDDGQNNLYSVKQGRANLRFFWVLCHNESMKANNKKTTLYVPDDVLKRARARALKEGVSLSEAMRVLLNAWLGGSVPIGKIRRVTNGGDENVGKTKQ